MPHEGELAPMEMIGWVALLVLMPFLAGVGAIGGSRPICHAGRNTAGRKLFHVRTADRRGRSEKKRADEHHALPPPATSG